MYYSSLEMVQKAFKFFFNFSLFWNPYSGTGTPLWAPVPPLLVPDSQFMLHVRFPASLALTKPDSTLRSIFTILVVIRPRKKDCGESVLQGMDKWCYR